MDSRLKKNICRIIFKILINRPYRFIFDIIKNQPLFFENFIQLMGLLRGLKQVVYKADMLHNSSLLRIKREPEHRTLLGGFLSIALMLVLVVAFYNKIIDTLDKVLISSSTTSTNADDPLPYTISTINKGPFMFGVQVWHHNLNQGPRYFDVELKNLEYIYGEPLDSSPRFDLQPCTKEHWEGFPEVQAQYDNISMNYWKCLPKNMDFEIRGKYSSAYSKTLSVAIKTCTNNSYQSRPCAPQEEIDEYFANTTINYFTIYFINPLINPDNQKFISYYLQDVNYIIFTPYGGEEGQLLLSDFQIDTDQSILPFSDMTTVQGGIVLHNAIKNHYSIATDTYATFLFFKSVTSYQITRSYEKVDDVFSYIGGLFGTIIMLFFLIGDYNAYKFEVNLAGYLYKCERNAEKIQKTYNFFHFVAHKIYSILSVFKCKPKWEKIAKYYKTRQQMLKQLDILYLIKRLNFLQQSLRFIFNDKQILGLHLASQLTLSEAISMRRNYRLKARIKQEVLKLQRGPSITHIESNVRQSNSASNSNTKIDFQTLNRPPNLLGQPCRPEFNQPQTAYIDHEDYSSQSSQQEQNQELLLAQMTQLHKDQQNSTNNRIWKGMDKMMRKMIQKYHSRKKIKNSIIQLQDEPVNNSKDPQSIEVFDFDIQETPAENNDEHVQQRKEHNSSKMMMSRLHTARIQKQGNFSGDIDEQFPQNSY